MLLVGALGAGATGCEDDEAGADLGASGAAGAAGSTAGGSGGKGGAGQGGAGASGQGGSGGKAGQGGAGGGGQGGSAGKAGQAGKGGSAGTGGAGAGGAGAGGAGAGGAGAGGAGAGGAGAGGAGAGGAGAGGAGAGGSTGGSGGAGLGLDSAPPASSVGALSLQRPLVDVFEAGSHALGAHPDKDLALLDLRDPASPQEIATLPTTGRVVSAHFDEGTQVVYSVDESGSVRAFRLLTPQDPALLAEVSLGAGAGQVRGIARVGKRLFVLAGTSLHSIVVDLAASGALSLSAPEATDIGDGATSIASGSGALYVSRGSGQIQAYSAPASGSPVAQGSTDLGGPIVGLTARGSRVLGLVKGVGLRVLDMADPAAPSTLYADSELNDAYAARLFGRLLVVGLERQYVSTVDLSDLASPRTMTTNKATLPAWVASAEGNVLLGTDTSVTVLGIPAFVTARVPKQVRESFPRYGRLPVTLSKAIDPATVSGDTVHLSCDGQAIAGSASAGIDGRRVVFVPAAALPPSATCSLTLDGVKDRQGAPVDGASSPSASFTTSAGDPQPIVQPKSAYPHTADGAFSDWNPASPPQQYEWFDVQPAKGMYSFFYADFDGSRLWLLNDWFYNGDAIEPDCYNQFQVWTGGGTEQWEIRAYGDQHVEVRKNGQLLDPSSGAVVGGYAHAPSPNETSAHTMYELGIQAAEGSWGVQLHDPGPTFNCHKLEPDPTSYQGQGTAGGGGQIDPTAQIAAPSAPKPSSPMPGAVDVSLPLSLSWASPDPWQTPRAYLVEIGEGADLTIPFYEVVAYGNTFDLPGGLLAPGKTYSWRATAWNAAGRAAGAVSSFTVATPAACVHSECDIGARLDSACSPCAEAICGSPATAYCCQTEWDQGCTAAATQVSACGCGGAGGSGGGGSGGSSGSGGSAGSGAASGSGGSAGSGAASGSGGSGGGGSGGGGSGGAVGQTVYGGCPEPAGLTVGEVTGDGQRDIVVACSGSNSVMVLPGKGAGAFDPALTNPLGTTSPSTVALGEFTGDSIRDIAVGAASLILAGLGGGKFTSQASAPGQNVYVTSGDVNGDGRADLIEIVSNPFQNLRVSISNSDGTFTSASYIAGPGAVTPVLADLNNDGLTDIVVPHSSGMSLTWLLGGPGGTFQKAQQTAMPCAPQSAGVGDFNGDGKRDIVAACSTGNIFVLLGNGDGTFGMGAAAKGGNGYIAVADFTGDKRPDVVSGSASQLVLFATLADGSFAPPVPVGSLAMVPGNLVAFDFNGNGVSDVVVADTVSSSVVVALDPFGQP